MKGFAVQGETVVGDFTPLEIELLGDLAGQVIELLDDSSVLPEDDLLAAVGIGGSTGPSTDPAIARLLPNAYLDDDHASQEFRYLTENSLVSRKVANARLLRDSLQPEGDVKLGPDAVQAWLRTLADIRLIIASRLGIEHDGDEGHADTFEQLVIDELDALPDDMIDGLDNVVFVTEDRPEDGSLDLLGLYDGVALTERGQYGFGELPDRIILYREPLLAICETLDELKDEIHVTLVHEIAHFYGINDEQLHELGWG